MFCTKCGNEILQGFEDDAKPCIFCNIKKKMKECNESTDKAFKTWEKKFKEEAEIRRQYMIDRARLGNYYSRAARHRRGEYPYEKGWRKYDEKGNVIEK